MTIKDVAVHSGVSVSTVSRVLNNHPDVSAPVREKVLKSIQTLHYVPNNSARDLVKPQSDSIGVIVRGAENLFFTSIILAVERAITDAGYTMVLHQIKAGEDELFAGASLTRSKRLRGLLFLGGCYDYSKEQVNSLEVPFVCCTFTNSFGSLDKSSFSSISIDDEEEAYKAVSYLTDRGHRTIAVLLNSKEDRSVSELRFRGYARALRDAGTEPDPSLIAEISGYQMDEAYEATKELVGRRPDVTAIFAIADSLGIAAIKALHDSGKRVPEDCSVIAIDGIELSRYTIPTLTTLIQPREIMGRKAVQSLVDVIEGKGKNTHLYLETELRPGESVADLRLT